MTSRLPWAGDSRPIWNVWEDFGIQESEMIGYLSPSCSIKTDSVEILATVYVQKSAAFQPADRIKMEPGKGRLLILEERIN